MKEAMTYPTGTIDPITTLRDGWAILVEQLGVLKATEFAVLLERGHGDTVDDIMRYWEDRSIDEIHSQVLSWKKTHVQNG